MLIPAFNAGVELQRTLSALATDIAPFDIVVVDDGSVPPLGVPKAAGGHRVVAIRLSANRGIAHALNAGLSWALARGYEYIARLDAGDVNEPSRLTTQVAFLDERPDIAIVGAWTRHVDEEGLRPIYTTRYPASWEDIQRCLHYRSPFSHVTCMIRASALRRIGIYDADYRLGEDYELFWRVASTMPCANIPRVLVTRVESRRSLTHANRLAMGRTRLAIQLQHFAWRRIDCWLGVARSVGLLLVPSRLALTLKRRAGTIGSS